MKTQAIRIKGARQHNLKNLNLEIPLNHITVVTGVSGSGKSSLAFDTLYAEGQRRYVETFSPYARQFMDRMDRPQVDKIEGIPPAIAIDRKDPVRTSRSTVGTMTEITDYVKLLYARLGQLHCKSCGKPVVPETPAHVWNFIKQQPTGTRLIITFPYRLEDAAAEEVRKLLMQMGFDRLYLAGRVTHLDEWQPVENETEIPVLADRLILRKKERERIMDSLELAYRFGAGRLDVWLAPTDRYAFSNQLQCADCSIQYNTPLPNLFSFNSPLGACETCRGFGRTIGIDLDLIIPDPARTLKDGAVKPFGSWEDGRMEFEDLMRFCRRSKIPTQVPFRRLKAAHRLTKRRSSKAPQAITASTAFSAGWKPRRIRCRYGYTFLATAAMTSVRIAKEPASRMKPCFIGWLSAPSPKYTNATWIRPLIFLTLWQFGPRMKPACWYWMRFAAV
jgi:excinuclease ABC subunit A